MPAQVLALFYTTLMFSQLEVVLTALACFWQYVGRGWVQGFGHSLVYTLWVLGPQKGPVFKPNGGQGKLPPLKLWQ
jgi:hypothetical protein